MPIILNVPGITIPSGANALDLCTTTYAAQVLAAGGVALNSAQSAILASLVTAASREIIRESNLRFDLATYNEILTPEEARWELRKPAAFKLSAIPVQNITRMATGRTTVLTILNTDQVTNQRATVAFAISGDVEWNDLEYTGLTLTRWASGTPVVSSLLFATYPTVNTLAVAINALGGGWTATVATGNTPDCGLFASTELVGAREPKNALVSGASLDIFTLVPLSYDVKRGSGIVLCYIGNGFGWIGGGWGAEFGGPADGLGDWGFGWGQYRITYTAGHGTIPEPLALICAEVVRNMLIRLRMNPNLKSETTGKLSWTARDALANLTTEMRTTLHQYKNVFF